MRILQDDAQRTAQVVLLDQLDIDAVIGDRSLSGCRKNGVIRLVIVVFPAPVAPTKAIFCPGFAYSSMSCRTVLFGT